MTQPSSRADRIRTALTQTFAPSHLELQDDSAFHKGHAGARAGGQTHYTVVMVAEAFRGLSRVARSRAVHAALAGEFTGPDTTGIHALSLTLRTPEEQAGAQ
jgi:BolA protein